MADFIFLYRGGNAEDSGLSPDEMQAYMAKWGAWIGELTQSGVMTQVGDALESGGRFVAADKVVSDGPFLEAKEVVGGFSVVTAADIDAAAEIAKGCPIFATGGGVEVRELAGMAPEGD